MNNDIIRKEIKQNYNEENLSGIIKSVIIGSLIALLSSFVLFFIFALFINKFFGDPDNVVKIFTAAAASISIFAGSFIASRKNGSRGLFTGFLTGALTSIIIFLIMLIFGSKANLSENQPNMIFRIIIILCQVIFGCVGGVFAVNSNGKVKKTSYKSKNKKSR